MISFFQIYLWFSNSFLLQFRIILPLTPTTLMPIYTRLVSEFGLTQTEAKICNMIYLGKTSEEIREELDIQLSTLKTHRKSIYRKTIERYTIKEEEKSTDNSKQQKLIFF
ncbi:MAG: helix-turn-helix transcriptional regulator [Leptospiraceae bacterium]|nr:helix-turn-helix transcriptional regulator [Leptospiraceae bacterium]